MVKVINNIYPCALGTTVSPNLDVFFEKSLKSEYNVISNKLEILEDALFESSKTSTHKMEKLAHLKNSVRKTENGKSRNWAIFEKLALNHIHIDLLYPLICFIHRSSFYISPPSDMTLPVGIIGLTLGLNWPPKWLILSQKNKWPFWPYLAIYGHLAIGPYATNMRKWGIPEKNYKNVVQQW